MNEGAPLVWRRGATRAGGASIVTFAAGSDEASAPVAVLVHGLGHWTDAAWGRLVPQLDPAWRYLAFDLPGFGASEKPDAPYDLPYFRSVLEEMIASFGAERFALIGHSLGGLLAADYAATHPGNVARLALIAPAGFAPTPEHLLYALTASSARWLFTRRPSRRFIAYTFKRSVADPATLDPAIVDRAYAFAQESGLRKAFAGVYAGAIKMLVNPRPLQTRLASYDGPVFCAWGAHDRYIPVKGLREVRRVYPQARTLLLERSGHLPAIEEPALLGAALREFLDGETSTSERH
ncbi:MAG TPA: alpha/beta fold hydrolase [Candidatus Acidoferrum sp.]|nr:alpha/beta fold hydrolase [Candidatus Acidoferrum sp.]